jgi:hypothetical protein
MPGVCTSMLSGVSAIGPQVWATDDTFHDGFRRAGKTKIQWGRSSGPHAGLARRRAGPATPRKVS